MLAVSLIAKVDHVLFPMRAGDRYDMRTVEMFLSVFEGDCPFWNRRFSLNRVTGVATESWPLSVSTRDRPGGMNCGARITGRALYR